MTVPSPNVGVPSVAVLFKLGGSLLEWAGLPTALDAMLEGYAARPVAIVVGGGVAANAVRRWDKIYQLGADAAHDLAIAAMDFNGRMTRELLRRRGRDVVTQPAELREGVVLVPEMQSELLHATDAVPPPSWDVTSDSLAAWLALRLGATRVILLKSTDPPDDRRLATAVASGLVDPCFPDLARCLQVAWINLRGDAIKTSVPMVP